MTLIDCDIRAFPVLKKAMVRAMMPPPIRYLPLTLTENTNTKNVSINAKFVSSLNKQGPINTPNNTA
ncbi:MAG: hypothetical protein ACD_63C00009G0001 [uncultured bacterium]|nr:MAG: hypothetical protein ACD_63C00009G0001 [uncultured bacterium]